MVFSLNCFAGFARETRVLFLVRAVYVVVSILFLRRSVAVVKGRWFVSVWGLASPQPTTERKEISLRAARDGGVVRESSQISPNQSFPPFRAARRFGLRFAFSNARPPLPPPRAAFCETRPNFGCIVVKPRGAGALGFASPSLTKGWDLPPRARRPSCETRPRLGKNLSLARARGADSSAFLRFA